MSRKTRRGEERAMRTETFQTIQKLKNETRRIIKPRIGEELKGSVRRQMVGRSARGTFYCSKLADWTRK